MEILSLSTNDISGGAARAAYRLHSELVAQGTDSYMLVRNRDSGNLRVHRPSSLLKRIEYKTVPRINILPLRLYENRRNEIFSPSISGISVGNEINSMSPDVLHCHWIADGFIDVASLKSFKKPIVWTLHDMWAFTGGCHYDSECGRYREKCGCCPMLGSDRQCDLSYWSFRKKRKAYTNLPLVIVSPSVWLAECARKSYLFRDKDIHIIHNGVDLDVFKPINKAVARNILNIPLSGKYILFGAMGATSDKRKGFQHLYNALDKLSEMKTNKLLVFGSSGSDQYDTYKSNITYLGQIRDDITLSLIYSAADVMVVPSIQENLANTVIESLACGTPVVAFNIGGMPDMIEHKKNGYLARAFDDSELAEGIEWVLKMNKKKEISRNARKTAEKKFDVRNMAKKYIDLYKEVSEK